MPIFAAVSYVVSAVATAWASIGIVGQFVVKTVATMALSRLIANRAMNGMNAGAQDAGARIQLAPATNNKLPVVYGSAYIAPVITDAKISSDTKTMWYVCTLCEKTSGTISFGNIYYDGKLVTFGTGADVAKVVSLTTNSDPVQVDTKIAGNLFMYLFTNGSSSGVNTGGQTAIQILQDSAIPVNDRWTSTDLMSNAAFMIVKVIYNRDADTVNLGQLNVQVTNTKTKPGEVLLDYMQDSVYGCAIPASQIDTASFTALDTYSDQTITYYNGANPSTQARYRINGPVNTGDNCLSNLQQLADSCDSWLQYSELTGKWKVVINKPYTGTLNDLYHVNSDVLIGGIDINPLDLNQTYNSLEVQYPDANIKDQTNYKVVDMTTVGTSWYDPTLLSPNEPKNRLVCQYPQVNNYVQAVYLGVRRLLQSREDLTITCNLDYSGIQVEAGDVVRVTLAEYGWTDKLFRVSQVQETKTPDGFLGARITAFEYNDTIYNDNAIQNYIPAANTGLTDPNIFDRPSTPVITTNTLANSGAVTSFTVSSNVPATGTTIYMDFNYGNNSNVSTHKTYTSTQLADGTPYTANTTVSIEINDLPVGNYYFSTTARNELAGRSSFASNVYAWNANLQANSVTYNNMAPEATGLYRASQWSMITYNGIFQNAASRTNYGAPFYINGSSVNSNYLNPYAQGTATTANGFIANSTGFYTPDAANEQDIVEGQDGWYIITYNDWTADTLNPGEVITGNISIGVTTNTTDTHIQICPFGISNITPSGKLTLITQFQKDAIISYNANYIGYINNINDLTAYTVSPNATSLYSGYCARNITANSTAYFVQVLFQEKQNKI